MVDVRFGSGDGLTPDAGLPHRSGADRAAKPDEGEPYQMVGVPPGSRQPLSPVPADEAQRGTVTGNGVRCRASAPSWGGGVLRNGGEGQRGLPPDARTCSTTPPSPARAVPDVRSHRLKVAPSDRDTTSPAAGFNSGPLPRQSKTKAESVKKNATETPAERNKERRRREAKAAIARARERLREAENHTEEGAAS